MNSSILNVTSKPKFDDLISNIEYHHYFPYGNSFNYNESISICVNHSDLFLLPSESSLLLEIKVTKADGTAATAGDYNLTNNAPCFLFDEIRFDLCGKTVDQTRNLGITSTMFNYLTANPSEKNVMENAGFSQDTDNLGGSDYHSFSIPLNRLMGVFHDHRKIIVNSRMDLVLTRARSDVNAIIQLKEVDYIIEISRLVWRIPHVYLNDLSRLSFLKLIDSGNYIPIPFRSWEYIENPTLPQANHLIWTAKVNSGIEKPRLIILALQTARKNKKKANPSIFDHCDLLNGKVSLNSLVFPYEDLHIDFTSNRFNILFDMFLNFQKCFYDKTTSSTIISKNDFKTKSPLIVFDCSNQPETVKSGAIDLKIDLMFKENLKAETSLNCLIIYDRVFEYSPIKNDIRRVI